MQPNELLFSEKIRRKKVTKNFSIRSFKFPSLALIVSLNLIGSFGLQIIIIRHAGLGAIADLYITAQTLPAICTAVACAGLQGVWLHRFSMSEKNSVVRSDCYVIALYQSAFIGLGAAFIFVFTTSSWFVILFPGLSNSDPDLIFYLSVMNWATAALSISFFPCLLMMRVEGEFIKSELIIFIATVISLIATHFALVFFGLSGAAIVFFVKALIVNVLHWMLCDTKISFERPQNIQIFEGLKDFIKLMAGNSIYKTMPIVDRFFGSLAPVGSITSYTLATSSVSAIGALLDRAFCAPIISPFGKLVHSRNYQNFKKKYRHALIRLTFFIVLVLVITLIFISNLSELFAFLFNTTPEAGTQIIFFVILLMGSLYAGTAGAILVAGFYALGDSKTPVIIGLIGFVFGLVLKIILHFSYGMLGIAAASSIYLTINSIIFFFMLERKVSREILHAS